MKIKTIIELRQLLNGWDYDFEMPDYKYIREFEKCNRWTHPDTLTLWDDILQETGYPPAPKDYLEQAFELTREFWHWDSDAGRISSKSYSGGQMQITYIAWTDDIEIAIKNRLARMYRSFMAEYSAQVILVDLFPDSVIMASSELDLVVGVDLAVLNKKHDSSFLVHVTKQTEWTESNIRNKAMKKMWLKDVGGRKHYYQREWNASHVVFGYTEEESDSTENINGHLIFRPDYVNDTALEAMAYGEQTYNDNEMVDFNNWLKKNHIKEHGARDMIVFKFGKFM